MLFSELSADISELEKKRLENIERNAKYLTDLGLSPTTSSRPAPSSSSSKSRKSKSSSVVAPVEIDSSLLRRSSRVAALPPVDYSEPSGPTTVGSKRTRGIDGSDDVASSREERDAYNPLPQDIAVGTFKGVDGLSVKEENETKSVAPIDGTSCGALDSQLEKILTTYLGKRFPDFGKASVMSESNGGRVPKFNKYPGVLEWKNCIYLWVNIGGSGGYTNNFFEKGRQMIWYGGSKMTSESKVVKRLVEAGKGTDEDRVILFARIEGEEYSCLGRVKYVALDLEASPIVIKWEFLDYDKAIKEDYFKDILKAGKCLL